MRTNEMLDRPVAFQRCFVRLTGSICGALLLSQAVYWQNKGRQDDTGWWFKTQKDWEDETGMTRRELDGARRACKGLILSERRGVPAKCYFKVDEDALEKALASVQSSLAENAKLDATKAPNRVGGKRQTTNRETTEETTEILSPDGDDLPKQPEDASEAKKRHVAFTKLWADEYLATFHRAYKHGGAKDGSAIKRLLSSTGKTPEELMAVARLAWRSPKLFNCKQAASLTGFDSRFNEICGEVAHLLQASSAKKQSGPQDF